MPNGRCRRRTTRPHGTVRSPRSRHRMPVGSIRSGRSRPESWAATRDNRSWSATPCMSSRRGRTCSMPSISPSEGYPLKWKYRPAVSANAIGEACCDSINRGAFYADGKILYNLLDGHTVAIDARTGRELWNTQIADLASGETVTMAPLVVQRPRDRWRLGRRVRHLRVVERPRSRDRPADVDRAQYRPGHRHGRSGRHVQACL